MGGSFDSHLFHGTNGSPQRQLGLSSYLTEAARIRPPLFTSSPPSQSKRDRLLAEAKTPEVKELVNQLYRPGGKVGDGGTADAIREEIATGKPVGDRNHSKKGKQRVKQIERILKKNPNHPDRELLDRLLKDLRDALGGH